MTFLFNSVVLYIFFFFSPLHNENNNMEPGGCEELKCQNYAVCEINFYGLPECVCPQVCIRVDVPICGSDGNTYENEVRLLSIYWEVGQDKGSKKDCWKERIGRMDITRCLMVISFSLSRIFTVWTPSTKLQITAESKHSIKWSLWSVHFLYLCSLLSFIPRDDEF